MRIQRLVLIACATLVAFSSALPAQTRKESQKVAQSGDLTGVWYPSSVNTFNFIWTDLQGQAVKDMPMTAWAREKFKGNHPIGGEYTALTSNDPNFSCLPPGVPNIYTHAYPIEFLQVPGRVVILFEYDHYVRQIFTDGREHMKDANPTWLGDSTGKWEGSDLVVDSVGFNDKTWLDVSGHPHSEALHLTERFRRVDHNTLMIEITVDDAQAYTMPLKSQRKYILKPIWNIMEYVCEDNRVSFLPFEQKVGTKGAQAADVAAQTGNSQSIVGDWKGTILLADGRSLPASASFSSASIGTINVADPSGTIKYEFQNLTASASGTITAITADGTNLVAKLSTDGKQMTGDIILASGTGHKISLSRP
jgi:hypothetical protein